MYTIMLNSASLFHQLHILIVRRPYMYLISQSCKLNVWNTQHRGIYDLTTEALKY
jgi:hypothetical protein